MAKSTKELTYWASVALYGLILVSLLLYLRFPGEKFRKFCERYIENSLPEISCSIGSLRYGFPLKIIIENIQLKSSEGSKDLIFEDSLLTVSPFWRNPLSTFEVQSSAFGGNHSAKLSLRSEDGRIALEDMTIAQIDLAEMEVIGRKLNRKISGELTVIGSASLSPESFDIVAARGLVLIGGGQFNLRKPILEQNIMGLEESSAKFEIKDRTLVFSEGMLKNKKLSATFAGNVDLAEQFQAGTVTLTGGIVPLAPIYAEKRQLKAIVARMQKRYNASALPYKVGGTVGKPTFAFGK